MFSLFRTGLFEERTLQCALQYGFTEEQIWEVYLESGYDFLIFEQYSPFPKAWFHSPDPGEVIDLVLLKPHHVEALMDFFANEFVGRESAWRRQHEEEYEAWDDALAYCAEKDRQFIELVSDLHLQPSDLSEVLELSHYWRDWYEALRAVGAGHQESIKLAKLIPRRTSGLRSSEWLEASRHGCAPRDLLAIRHLYGSDLGRKIAVHPRRPTTGALRWFLGWGGRPEEILDLLDSGEDPVAFVSERRRMALEGPSLRDRGANGASFQPRYIQQVTEDEVDEASMDYDVGYDIRREFNETLPP